MTDLVEDMRGRSALYAVPEGSEVSWVLTWLLLALRRCVLPSKGRPTSKGKERDPL